MKERPFWTAYRKLYAAELLSQGLKPAVVGARLGVDRRVVQRAIGQYRLRDPKWLLGSCQTECAWSASVRSYSISSVGPWNR